jgi:hypothetical protein
MDQNQTQTGKSRYNQGGFDGDKQNSRPITASQARSKANSTPASRKSKDTNYNLTIRRLYKIIENASNNGVTTITYKAPSFVLDGCIGDPIILARQLKSKLTELGYKVRRTNATLLISWKQ